MTQFVISIMKKEKREDFCQKSLDLANLFLDKDMKRNGIVSNIRLYMSKVEETFNPKLDLFGNERTILLFKFL